MRGVATSDDVTLGEGGGCNGGLFRGPVAGKEHLPFLRWGLFYGRGEGALVSREGNLMLV